MVVENSGDQKHDPLKDGGIAQKKPKRKAVVAAGIVAAIILVAGAGMLAWHEQPSFCGAICHTPMDAYYDTYADGSADKYGNELDTTQSGAMMAVAHREAGLGCLDCHEPTVSQQIGEGIAWVSGSYVIAGTSESGMAYLESRSIDDLMEAQGKEGHELCLNEDCHDVSIDDLESLTEDVGGESNPHSSQHSSPVCGDCHKAHSQSVVSCSECHRGIAVPDGWLTATEAKALA